MLFTKGDRVRITEGPSASFSGVVDEVDEVQLLKALVSIFGREAFVELRFGQVQKVA